MLFYYIFHSCKESKVLKYLHGSFGMYLATHLTQVTFHDFQSHFRHFILSTRLLYYALAGICLPIVRRRVQEIVIP